MKPRKSRPSRQVAAFESPTSLDIAWAAGFIEGEGGFAKNGVMSVVQMNPDPLIKLLIIFGGRVYARKQSAKRLIGTDSTNIWCWEISGPRGRGVAMTIYKFMSDKRKEQIKRCLSNG
jgi:hypothetical protein